MHDIRDFVVLAGDAAMSTTYKPALLKGIVRLQREAGREALPLLTSRSNSSLVALVDRVDRLGDLDGQPRAQDAQSAVSSERGTQRDRDGAGLLPWH